MAEGKTPDANEVAKSYTPELMETETDPESLRQELRMAGGIIRSQIGPKSDLSVHEEGVQKGKAALKTLGANSFLLSNPEIQSAHSFLLTNLNIDSWTKPKPGQLEKELEREDPPGVDDPNELEEQAIPDYVRPHVESHFENLTGMRREEYDTFDIANDAGLFDKGQLLYFYPGGQRTDDAPIIGINFRKDGFTLLYWNASNFPENKSHVPEMNSIYSENGKKFQLGQLDEALLRAKNIIHGVAEEDKSMLDEMPNDEDRFIPTPEELAELESM